MISYTELHGEWGQVKPISAYDDNPVFNDFDAARFVGVTADCLKKWRQRQESPDRRVKDGNRK